MRVRLATATDAAAVRSIYGPVVEATAISFELVTPTVEAMAARIVDRQPAHPWLVAEDDEGVAGYAYAGRIADRRAYDWAVESSVYVAERARGRGVGRRLYRALLAVLEAQGHRQVLAGIALPNPASVALHESTGFLPIGTRRAVGWKLGRWHDVGWWQRPLGAGDTGPPTPVLGLDELDPAVLAAALAL